MKQLLLLSKFIFITISVMLALPSAAQSYITEKYVTDAVIRAGGINAAQESRRFVVTEIYSTPDSGKWRNLQTKVIYITDGDKSVIQAPGDTARLFFPSDPSRILIGTVTWRWADQQYDTTYTETARIDDPATSTRWTDLVNIGKATNSAKTGVYNKSFSFVNTAGAVSSASITVTCDRVELFSERWQGHGNVKVFIDGQQVRTLSQGNAPYVTDFSRMVPSFYWIFPKATPTSPATSHTLRLETDPSNQYIIDMIRTLNYTLTVRK